MREIKQDNEVAGDLGWWVSNLDRMVREGSLKLHLN